MLATSLNHLIHSNQLASFTVIRVVKHICNQIGQQTKKVVVILEVEILAPGSQVGAKLGSPVQISSDGKIPDSPASQNSNPNAGVAFKRVAGPGGVVQPPVKIPRSAASSEQYNVQPINSITPYQNKWTIKAR